MADPILKKGSATVTVACSTAGAKILYQLGTATEQEYSNAVSLLENTLFKARATKAGMTDSDTAEQQINIQLPDLEESTTEGTDSVTIKITNARSAYYGEALNKLYTGSVFKYTTDGTDPDADTSEDMPLTDSVVPTVTVTKNCTVKIRAFATNNVASEIVTVEVSSLKVATPTISVA